MASVAQVQKGRELQRPSAKFRKWDSLQRPKDLSLDLFRCISDWHHYAILELTFVEGFDSDPKWLASQLGISNAEALYAVDRLLQVRTSWNGGMENSLKPKAVSHLPQISTSPPQLFEIGSGKFTEKSIRALQSVPIENRSQTAI